MKLTVVAKYCMWQNRMHNPGEQNKTTRRHTQPHCFPLPCPGHSPCRNRPKYIALMGSIFWMLTPHSQACRNEQDQCQRETRHRYGRTRWAKKNRFVKIGPRDRGGESAAGVVYRLGFLSAFSPACLRLLLYWRLYLCFRDILLFVFWFPIRHEPVGARLRAYYYVWWSPSGVSSHLLLDSRRIGITFVIWQRAALIPTIPFSYKLKE